MCTSHAEPMTSIKERIFRYPDLTSVEQADLEEAIEAHPDRVALRSLLSEVKGLDDRLHRTPLPPEEPDSSPPLPDALLALYAVRTEHDLDRTWSPAMQQAFAEVENHLDHDSDLRARMDMMQERVREVQSAVDPTHHFESIAGYNLNTSSASASEANAASPASSSANEPNLLQRLNLFSKHLTYSLAGAGAALLLYGALFLLSMTMQSPAERMAALDRDQTNIEGYEITTRSIETTPQSNDEQFLMGLEALDRSYTTTLGLFPRFDDAKLARAQEHFEALVEDEPSDSFLQLEARFFLGKTYLAQENIEGARDAFRYVVIGEGARASEASALLENIQDHYPMEVPEALPGDAQM